MKKTYIKPVSEAIALTMRESVLLTASANNGKWQGDPGDGYGEQYSHRRGWNSSDWSAQDDSAE